MDICKYLESKVADADILVGLLVIDGFGSDKHSDCNITMIECFSPLKSTFHFLSVLFQLGHGVICDQ